MSQYKYIIESVDGVSGRITLNRPEVHNAFNIEMIRELKTSVVNLCQKTAVRFIIIEAKGSNFSAGADLNWMKDGLRQSEDELYSGSRELASLFNTLYNAAKVTIVLTKGKVFGGANGIVAAADIAIASPETVFAFTEVKLGLVPATIAPYIVQKTGKSTAREWMLTGRKIAADEALQRGLVNRIIPASELDEALKELTEDLTKNGPLAMEGIKMMFLENDLSDDPGKLLETTSRLIAKFRIADEGQEGIRAFFEKRLPRWNNE